MSLRTALLPVLDIIASAVAGPAGLDVRPYVVVLRKVTWSGGAIQTGTKTITDVSLTPRYEVKEKGSELTIGPITPAYTGGGFAQHDLVPLDQAGVEFYYLVTGPDGVQRVFVPIDIDTTDPFGTYVKVTSTARKVPF